MIKDNLTEYLPILQSWLNGSRQSDEFIFRVSRLRRGKDRLLHPPKFEMKSSKNLQILEKFVNNATRPATVKLCFNKQTDHLEDVYCRNLRWGEFNKIQ